MFKKIYFSGQIPSNNKRIYYCQRCLNHGKLEPRKNHKSECIYASCICQKCILVEKRRVLNTQLHELEENVLHSSLPFHDFTQHRERKLTNASDMTSIAEEDDVAVEDTVFNNKRTKNDSESLMDLTNDWGNGNEALANECGRIKGGSFNVFYYSAFVEKRI